MTGGFILLGTLKGSPSPPALWLRRAKPASANAIVLVAGLALVAAAAGLARAEVAAELEGEVQGADGEPLPGVDLVITDAGGRGRQAAVADADGRFQFLLPAPGVWRLALHGVGPAGARVGSVVVQVPARARVRVRLRISDDGPAAIDLVPTDAADDLPAPGAEDRLPARGASVGQALTAVPGATAPAPPGDGPVLAGTDPGEADMRLGGFSLRDPVDGRVPWELPQPLFGAIRPHLGTGDAVDGEAGRAGVDLFVPRAERRLGLRLLAAGEVVAPAPEVRGSCGTLSGSCVGRPGGWQPAGLLLAGVEGRSAGGRLRGRLTVAPDAAGWETDPTSARFARSRRTRVLPVLAHAEAEAAGFELALTALALATRRRLGRPPGVLAAAETQAEARDLALVGLKARRQLVRGLDAGLRAGLLGGRGRWEPLAGDPLRTSGQRLTLAGELGLVGEAAGRHRLRIGAGLDGERARRRGPDAVRAGEPAVERASASGRTLHVAADERYRPFDWVEAEAGLRLVATRAQGRAELPGLPALDRMLEPGLLLAPRAGLALLPLAGARLEVRAGRFGGPAPLQPLLAGTNGPPGELSVPAEDVALAQAALDRGAWRVSAIALERRTAEVMEDRLSPATGRLELIRPRIERHYRALIGSAEARTRWLDGGAAVAWSRLRGNHEGFTDPYTGRLRPAATVAWDALAPDWTSGPLPFDRPLSLRLHAAHARALRCASACRLSAFAAFRVDAGTPRSARGWSPEGGEGVILTAPRGSLGRAAAVTRLDAGVELSFLAAGRLTTVAVQGANLTNHRPVLAREQLATEGPGAAALRPTAGNPVAWAEPVSLKLVLGLAL